MPLTERDLAVDKELTEIAGELPLLALITPVNVPLARRAFFAGEEPTFAYRELPDLDAISNRLDKIDISAADDATVAHLAEALAKELKLRLELLRNRDTEQAFFVAIELFGHVEDKTLNLAEAILNAPFERQTPERTLNGSEFAVLAQKEIDEYRAGYPELSAKVLVTDSRPGLMVEAGDLYIGVKIRIDIASIPGLLAHEIGTHVVTFCNGGAQPLQMLSLGLAHYNELQEAMGVMAEYLTSGLDQGRLRMLASRVLVAHRRAMGITFREAHSDLLERGFRRGEPFTTVMRAYRAGGNTKDAGYLRGLQRLVEHLRSGADIEALYVGKISFESVPLIAELMNRGVLNKPPLRPRFLDEPIAQARLGAIKNGEQVLNFGGRDQ